MSSYVPSEVRRFVAKRAGSTCEYCLIHEADTFYGCEVDHIVSVKHGGPSDETNLAFACMTCNRNKGSDLGSLTRRTRQLVRFFNPRTDRWMEHFRLSRHKIQPLTEIGEVTVKIFKFNDPDRVLERRELTAAGRYPSRVGLSGGNPA